MRTRWSIAILITLLLTGCQGAPKDWYEPETRLRYGPLTGLDFKDTKDNKVKAEVEYNPDTGQFKGKLDIDNSASAVNESQVALMAEYLKQQQAFADILRVHGENLDKALGRLTEMTGQAAQLGAEALNALRAIMRLQLPDGTTFGDPNAGRAGANQPRTISP